MNKSTASHTTALPTLEHPAVYTDYYELTMAQGYFLAGRAEEQACFDYFFRDLPFNGGYVVFAGLSDLLETIKAFRFQETELQYLARQGFREEFINYLRELDIRVSINAAREGEIIFPSEPVLRISGGLVETQIMETLLLNILNFESLIATKARRMKFAAGDRKVLDFGLRRAQGYGGIQASKAAYIGGVEATSNVYAAFQYGVPASGTMAHSWVQSYEDELAAFRAYAQYYPEDTILLVDTYNTLSSGVPNAIKVARELEKKGHRLKGIRLDSGDLAYLSRKARNQLDRQGLEYVKIAASNQLDERLINSLLLQGAPIDLFGVGTRLVTGHESPALDGVYKLAAINKEPKLKISENVEKITLPGLKHVNRYFDGTGNFVADGIVLDAEKSTPRIFHPHFASKHMEVARLQASPLLQPVMKDGVLTDVLPTAGESAAFSNKQFHKLNAEHKRFDNPHIYRVGISQALKTLRDDLISNLKS